MVEPFPRKGRLAGIDFGTVRLGIAICDADQTIASPVETCTRRNEKEDARHLQRLAEEEDIVGFVLGLPVHASGEESDKSREARRFGHWLAAKTNRPVCFFDERYTSVAAERILGQAGLTSKQRKKRRDMLAAQIILTAYLETPPGAGESVAALDD